MKKYKLIKEYPGSRQLGFVAEIHENAKYFKHYFYPDMETTIPVEAFKNTEFWEEIIDKKMESYLEDKKYYQPQIEEFHVGFECEFKNDMQDNIFKHEICDQDTLNIVYDEFEHGDISEAFRVKFLDKEDVESLGSTSYYEKNNIHIFTVGDVTLELDLNFNEPFMYIYQILLNSEKDILFQGTIKNKSELKKLFKQLNINYR